MGGKSYYCDYCECFMKNDINVRKKHNEGMAHNIAKTSYMRRFESPSKLLAEESVKVPCTRYLKGYCKFDLACQYGHFSEQQLTKLRKIVKSIKRKKKRKQKHPQNSIQVLPWHMTILPTDVQHKLLKKNLPPSLRPIDLQRLSNYKEKKTWG